MCSGSVDGVVGSLVDDVVVASVVDVVDDDVVAGASVVVAFSVVVVVAGASVVVVAFSVVVVVAGASVVVVVVVGGASVVVVVAGAAVVVVVAGAAVVVVVAGAAVVVVASVVVGAAVAVSSVVVEAGIVVSVVVVVVDSCSAAIWRPVAMSRRTAVSDPGVVVVGAVEEDPPPLALTISATMPPARTTMAAGIATLTHVAAWRYRCQRLVEPPSGTAGGSGGPAASDMLVASSHQTPHRFSRLVPARAASLA
jgi:hypothetical protein